MAQHAAPFPDPPIPDVDSTGLRVPPWIKYPNIPIGSVGWRMGVGEDYWFGFRDWWLLQPGTVRLRVKTTYPEPESWSGFYSRVKSH